MIEFDKIDFHKYLKSINAKGCTFFYYANGNDPCNPCGTVCRQAKYEFYVIAEGFKKLIVWKNHRRSHDVVEEQLRKKFGRWANEYFKKAEVSTSSPNENECVAGEKHCIYVRTGLACCWGIQGYVVQPL